MKGSQEFEGMKGSEEFEGMKGSEEFEGMKGAVRSTQCDLKYPRLSAVYENDYWGMLKVFLAPYRASPILCVFQR